MQRKCGTCKFFEEGGIASSGWCRHPDRQDLEHMVLVRKSELACRDGWDHDLWEPRESGGNAKAGSAGKVSGMSEAGRTPRIGEPNLPATPAPAVATTKEPVPAQSGSNPDITTYRNGSTSFSDGVDELKDETIVYRPAASAGSAQQPHTSVEERERATFEPIPRPNILDRRDDGRGVANPDWDEPSASTPQNGSDEEHKIEEPVPVRQSGMTEQFDVEPQEPATFGVAVADEETSVEAIEESDEDDSGSSLQLPMLQASNACCRNCRDFLPAQNSKGGWCNNPYAFQQRKEVTGSIVACQSSFGSWWSPSDDWWMERADIAHHSAPTPLVDNLIRTIRSRYLEEDGSTEGQERS